MDFISLFFLFSFLYPWNFVSEKQEIRIGMVGDVLIHSRVYQDAYKNGRYDFYPMVYRFEKKFQKNDLNYFNQESLIGGKELGLSTYPRFNSPEEIGEAMVKIGGNLVSLANNHSLDKGEKGVKNSQRFWKKMTQKKNIIFAGSYENQKDKYQVYQKNGIKFTFFAYTTLTNGFKPKNELDVDIFDKEKVRKDILWAKKNSDFVIVSLHWGQEYNFQPTKKQQEIAKFLADLGVDLVIGSHPHVIGKIEKIKNTLVVYSLGNFLSSQIGLEKRIGLYLSLRVVKNPNGKIEIKDIKPELFFVKYNKKKPRNFEVIPFDELNENILKNYKEIEKEYLKKIGWLSYT